MSQNPPIPPRGGRERDSAVPPSVAEPKTVRIRGSLLPDPTATYDSAESWGWPPESGSGESGPSEGAQRPLADRPTEVIGRVDPLSDDPTMVNGIPPAGIPPAGLTAGGDAPPPDRARKVVSTVGEVFVTLGLVMLLFVFYEIYVTDWLSAGKQRQATDAIDQQWRSDPSRSDHYNVAEGQGFAKLHIPAFGPDYAFTLLEGTTDKDLDIGPGHYIGTAMPGQAGDFAVAGHRVGKGAPFNDLDLLQSCDAVIVETANNWYVYRVLPMSNEVSGWAAGRGQQAQCGGVAPPSGPYKGLVGQEIVLPTEGDVIAPVPHHLNAQVAQGQQLALMTLTTCNPRFSAAQRLIVHTELVKQYPKDPKQPNWIPPEFKETS